MRYTMKANETDYVLNENAEEEPFEMRNKLGQLEDVLEKYDMNTILKLDAHLGVLKELATFNAELGIDLVTLIKVNNDGAYYKEDLRHYIAYVDLKHKCIRLVKHYEAEDDFDCHYVRFKDYGKTWALTKEELL